MKLQAVASFESNVNSFMGNAASSSSSPSSAGAVGNYSNANMTAQPPPLPNDTASPQMPDATNSLDSRIAALFNINVSLPGFGGVGASAALASSSSLASSSVAPLPNSSASSGLMPSATATTFHFDHFGANANFIAKSPTLTSLFQVRNQIKSFFKRVNLLHLVT